MDTNSLVFIHNNVLCQMITYKIIVLSHTKDLTTFNVNKLLHNYTHNLQLWLKCWHLIDLTTHWMMME